LKGRRGPEKKAVREGRNKDEKKERSRKGQKKYRSHAYNLKKLKIGNMGMGRSVKNGKMLSVHTRGKQQKKKFFWQKGQNGDGQDLSSGAIGGSKKFKKKEVSRKEEKKKNKKEKRMKKERCSPKVQSKRTVRDYPQGGERGGGKVEPNKDFDFLREEKNDDRRRDGTPQHKLKEKTR